MAKESLSSHQERLKNSMVSLRYEKAELERLQQRVDREQARVERLRQQIELAIREGWEKFVRNKAGQNQASQRKAGE